MQIFIDIIGAQDNVTVSLMTLPHHSGMYKFRATTFVDRISVQGCLFPQLHLTWPSFIIQHKFLSKQVKLPTRCKINPYQARKIARILNTSFELLLFTRDGNSQIYRLVPIEGSTWQKIQVEHQRLDEGQMLTWNTIGGHSHNLPQ